MESTVVLEHYGEQKAKDILLCHQVNAVLNKHYPGHPWLIGANHEAGTINVQLTYLDKHGKVGKMGNWGFLLHIAKVKTIPDLEKKVMLAGGELLERWQLARDKATDTSWQKAKENTLITDGGRR